MTASRRMPRLRTVIIAWSFIPAAIILGIVALAHFASFQYLTEDLITERNHDLAVLLATQYMGEVNEMAQPLRVLASDIEIISADPLRQQTALSAARDQLWDFDAGVIVLNSEGQITAANERRLGLVGSRWADQPFFTQTLARGSLTLSDIVPAGPANRDAVIMAVPVYDDRWTLTGVVVGIVAVGMAEARVTDFYSDIRKVMLDAGSSTYLVDGAGRVIYHPETQYIGTSRAGDPVIARVQTGATGTLRATDASGQDIIASYAPVPQAPWGVIVEEDWDTLAAASQPYQRALLVLLVLGLLIPAAVVALGVRRITRPIHALIRAAQAAAGGDFSPRITARGSAEIAELAEQFNHMTGQLHESYATLEQRVADRTRDLAALNAITAVASRSLALDEVLGAALDKTLDVTGMAVGAAYRLDAAHQTLHLVAQRGLPSTFAELAGCVPRASSVAGQVDAALRPALLRVADYPEGVLKRILTEQGVQLALSIPLVAKQQVLGFINLGSRDVRALEDDELALMASIGQQVGVAVENARLYERAEEAAAAAERSRLARELHDAVSQTLFSASMIAGVLPRLWDRDQAAAREQLAQLQHLTKGAQAEMRILLLELRPAALVETPLGDLLEQLAQATGSRAMVPVALTVTGTCDPPVDVRIALYRIAQEALNNVVKHADAAQVTLALTCEGDTITLVVHDDGCGFDPDCVPPDRLGQRTMRERADTIGAQFAVTSAAGQGTTVMCCYNPRGSEKA